MAGGGEQAGMDDGEILKLIRQRKGLTLQQAADKVHVTWTTWWRWEQSDRGKAGIPMPAFELFMLKVGEAKLVQDPSGKGFDVEYTFDMEDKREHKENE